MRMQRKLAGLRRAAAAALLAALLTVSAAAALPEKLIPGGNAVGIQLCAQGLMVTEVEAGSCAARAGIKKGDILLCANGKALDGIEPLLAELQAEGALELRIRRAEQEKALSLQPERKQGRAHLGLTLRQSVAGIGTLTYYNPQDGSFGALGHGVNDQSSLRLLPIASGRLIPAGVQEVKKGARGAPGELHGVFEPGQTLGSVEKNTDFGIFGTLCAPPAGAALPVAAAEEVQPGPALIYANVDGTQVQAFTVELERVEEKAENGRNLLLRVTDPALLKRTGGIVQGMSGSPIVQNGRLVGAVTHVLVNQPERGYGVLIQTMLQAAEED